MEKFKENLMASTPPLYAQGLMWFDLGVLHVVVLKPVGH